ncbi:MAG: nucleotidyltransferase family protein, partial [Cyanobacteria bacterium J06621_12]
TNRIAEQPYLNFFLFHEFYGYQKSFDIHNTNSNIIVELHWSLFNNSFAFPAEFELMWKDKINVKVEEAEIYTFGSQDLLIYLCAHASKHCWSCLQWICDIAELIRANPLLDWQKIQDKAKEMGCSRMLYIGLILAQDLLDAELSENIRQKINRDRQAKALAKEVKDRLFNFSDPKFNSYLFILRCRERYRDKLQFLICLLCVPKQEDWRFIRLPQYLHFFYYAIRPLRLLIKAGKISGNSLK